MRILSRTFMLNVITVGNKGSSSADPVLVARKTFKAQMQPFNNLVHL